MTLIPPVDPQHPKVRAQDLCVACGLHSKPKGLVLHWMCHSMLKERHDGGYGRIVDRALDDLEEQLTS